MVQHGRTASVLAAGRRTWPCRYGRQHLVTGPCSRAAFCASPHGTAQDSATAESPSLGPPWSIDGDGRQVFESRSFQGRTDFEFFFPLLQVSCCTVAPCVQSVTGRGHELADEGVARKGTVHASHFTDHEANSFASCQQTASACLFMAGRLCGMAVGGGSRIGRLVTFSLSFSIR